MSNRNYVLYLEANITKNRSLKDDSSRQANVATRLIT